MRLPGREKILSVAALPPDPSNPVIVRAPRPRFYSRQAINQAPSQLIQHPAPQARVATGGAAGTLTVWEFASPLASASPLPHSAHSANALAAAAAGGSAHGGNAAAAAAAAAAPDTARPSAIVSKAHGGAWPRASARRVSAKYPYSALALCRRAC